VFECCLEERWLNEYQKRILGAELKYVEFEIHISQGPFMIMPQLVTMQRLSIGYHHILCAR
jgi:hypothetical protein